MSTTTTIPYVIAFTRNHVYAGLLHGTQAQVGTGGLVGPDIESCVVMNQTNGRTLLYAVDASGSIIVDVLRNQIIDWAAEVARDGVGSLPEQCALICNWRGRAVLARQPDNPAIFYMSRTLNPLDWAFGNEPLATTAIVGTDPEVGQPHDAIMSLMPFSQDYLLFGCLSSIYVAIGDPGYGGKIQILSKRTGVLGPRAFCFDENGTLYALGNSGLFRMIQPNGVPEPLMGNKLVGILDRVNVATTRIQMKYDAFKHEVHIYLTPIDGTTVGQHIICDRASGACWMDQYPLVFGPHSAVEIDGEPDDDRRILIGGDDGYIRAWSSGEPADDGTAITSYFDSAPMEAEGGVEESTATELQSFGYSGQVASAGAVTNSDAVTYEWYVADSSDEVRRLASSPTKTGSLFTDAGYNRPIGLRITGGAHKIRITHTSSTLKWGMEKLIAKFVRSNRRR